MDLSYLNSADWNRQLGTLPQACQDVYFTPEYHALHVANGDGQAQAMLLAEGGRSLLIPGLRVAIPEAGGPGVTAPQWDWQTCNGYGGPLASADAAPEFLETAWREWRQASRRQGVIAAFFRLHPLLGNVRWLPAGASVRRDRATMVVELSDGMEATWQRADSRHRNMVNKGRKEGTRVAWDDPADWAAFAALYHESMERLGAPETLRFGPGYFAALRNLPGAHVAGVRVGGEFGAGAIFLFGSCWAHYHLSARRVGAGNHLTNCLLQAALERAVAAGLQRLHLGGGRTAAPDDALLRFKQSLGGRLLDFQVALVVADEAAYEARCAAWAVQTGRRPEWYLGYRQPRASEPNPKAERNPKSEIRKPKEIRSPKSEESPCPRNGESV